MKKLLKFSTPTCVNCRQLAIFLQQIDLSGIEVEEIDALERPDLVAKYDFVGVPTLVLLEDSAVINQYTGLLYPDTLEQFIKGEKI